MTIEEALERARKVQHLYHEDSAAFIGLGDLIETVEEALPRLIDRRKMVRELLQYGFSEAGAIRACEAAARRQDRS